ncbi:hypothetical protein [Desulfospira joergensenii]|uniref:hypothetical protein n=1 Tax=Desulfospira joergensenii TaxID=53329 RepID=UPI0003B5332A|nr:hypothetical protein [Desulfospira joergensenii]
MDDLNYKVEVNIYENSEQRRFVPQFKITANGATKSVVKRGHLYDKGGKPVAQAYKAPGGQDKIDFSKGWKNFESAKEATYKAFGQDVELKKKPIVFSKNKKDRTIVFEKDGKFIPVTIAPDPLKNIQINNVLKIIEGRLVERGHSGPIGKVQIDSKSDGFRDMKTALSAVKERWGNDLKPEHIKINSQKKVLEKKQNNTRPGSAVQRLQQLRQSQGQGLKMAR